MHLSKKYFPFFILLLLTSCSVSSRLKKADKRYDIGEYYAAAELYNTTQRSINKKDKELKALVLFKMGECYRLLNNNSKAIRSYARAISSKYKEPEVYLRYAQVLHKNGQYSEALKNYKLYLKYNPENTLAKDGILACEQMDEWKKNPTRYVVKPASFLNSRKNSEFCPTFIGKNSESLVITTNRDNKINKKSSAITGLPNNNFLFTKKNATGQWEELQLFEGEFNTGDDEGACCFSLDGKTIYFTRCRSVKGSSLGAEIYKSVRSGAQWASPTKVVLFNDSSISTAHPALSPDGKYLYFVSDNKDGFGGKDIWRSEIKSDDSYAMPENLGEEINTEADEMFPSFDAQGNLYFSSNGHTVIGGLDIFKATQDSVSNWQISNMGIPINSSADDFGITFVFEQESGFFSSNRNQSKGYDKIWSFVLPEVVFVVEGVVVDQDGEVLQDAIVKLIGNNGTNVKQRAKKDGTYRMVLEKNEQYVMLASCRGYLNQSFMLSTDSLTDSKSFKHEFELVSISKPIQIDNIFYEFGKWNLTASSEKALEGLVKLLNDNPNITIEIASHTDMKGNEEFNMNLSEKRAQSVVDFLVRSGIESERLTAKGYGKSKPMEVSKQLAKKYRFLKEGHLLDEKYCELFTQEQKDIIDQINRRTEFKVIKTTYNLY
ncbi:MAG: OmpA family protein [Paludibacteraceae bacterium]|nr:OmpA family protein [Paludibacteraceae bacterium]